MNSNNLKGKNAIITGSTSGIGLAIATALAANGCNIVINGFGDPDQLNNILEVLINDYKVQAQYCSADVRRYNDIAEMIEKAEASFGSVDILVNNAGIQYVSPIETFPLEKWDDVMHTNLFGAFYTIKAALPVMKKNNFGRIINIASAHGLVASANKSAYVAAKHGIIGLTKTVALENALSDITCNAICPGWVATDLVLRQIEAKAKTENTTLDDATKSLVGEKQPNKRFVNADEIANIVCFLSNTLSRSITGTAISVDGGWTAI